MTYLYIRIVNVQGFVLSIVFPEIKYQLFCFLNIKQQVVLCAPSNSTINLAYVFMFIIITDQADDGSVICILDDVTVVMFSDETISIQDE